MRDLGGRFCFPADAAVKTAFIQPSEEHVQLAMASLQGSSRLVNCVVHIWRPQNAVSARRQFSP